MLKGAPENKARASQIEVIELQKKLAALRLDLVGQMGRELERELMTHGYAGLEGYDPEAAAFVSEVRALTAALRA